MPGASWGDRAESGWRAAASKGDLWPEARREFFRPESKRGLTDKWIGVAIPRSVLTRDEEAHRHYQAHEQAENPQRIQGGEAGRALGVYRSDKGGNEPAFVRIGSKYSFLHRLIRA